MGLDLGLLKLAVGNLKSLDLTNACYYFFIKEAFT